MSSTDLATASSQESLGTSCAGKPTCDMSRHGRYRLLYHVHTGTTSDESQSIHTCLYIVMMQRLTAHLHSVKSPPYVINLDPAVRHVPYSANIGDRLLLLPLIIIIFISLSLSVFLSQISETQ